MNKGKLLQAVHLLEKNNVIRETTAIELEQTIKGMSSKKKKLTYNDEIAHAIMRIDYKLLTKYKKESGSDLKQEPLRTEFLLKVRELVNKNELKFPLRFGVAERLEWENFHTALAILMEEKLINYNGDED